MEGLALNQITSQLKELGLSTHEALTYITLLNHPSISASAICSETKIPDSRIYYALDELSKKGMIFTQKGNPTIYRPVPPKEAITNIKQQLNEVLAEKIQQADILIDRLTPLYDCAEKPEEIEIAYILCGQKNIINRLRTLIQASQHEITIFMTIPEVVSEIHRALKEAKEKRRIKLKIAVTPEIANSQDLSDLGEVKLLFCDLALFISDMKTIVTLTNWASQSALMTQDQSFMRVCRDYYDNPKCCGSVSKQK
jgi:sugar-specific transcriptional regulator TrmB